MMRRALAVAMGVIAVCFPLAAEQPHRAVTTRHRPLAPERLHAAAAFDPALAFSLFQPNAFSSKDSFLLLHRGPVHAWSDGGQLASENALASSGMVALDVFSGAYLPPPDTFGPAPTNTARAPSDSRPQNFGTDPKDSPETVMSQADRFYYGGEIGFLYGHSIGKGSGDMTDSYISGQVGNDHLQINAGASFENWSGQTSRFHSFNLSR
ncbi:MAG: hypothetical protein WBX14_07125 [Candidatus Udaeobacter sp.]